MIKAYLGLGSNIGDTKKNIDTSIELLKQHPKIKVLKISSFYETEPIGFTEQEWFLNIVVEIETELQPYDLLDYCNEIESILKRKRILRWGPRTIDIDILLYGDYISTNQKLTIPHPRMMERAFVMIPLKEIAPNIVIMGKSIDDIIKGMKTQKIRKIEYGKEDTR